MFQWWEFINFLLNAAEKRVMFTSVPIYDDFVPNDGTISRLLTWVTSAKNIRRRYLPFSGNTKL